MAKHGFLDVLEAALDNHFTYDYELNWDKKNHADGLAFILDALNAVGMYAVVGDGSGAAEDIFLEEFVLFYNPEKSTFDAEDYLVALPFDPKKGLSREFLTYFSEFLQAVADQGMDDLLDFLADETAEDFALSWNVEEFEAGKAELAEKTWYGYPRY